MGYSCGEPERPINYGDHFSANIRCLSVWYTFIWEKKDEVAEGDKVVTRYTTRGTQLGSFMGMPPTGKYVTVTGIAIARFANGKVVEEWGNADDLGLLQQLGVVPATGQAN